MKFPDKKPIITYTHNLRSRYGETDKMGYVYYSRYLEYFEVARTEMIRSFGFSYGKMEESGVMLPVIHAELDYRAPVFYDVEMQITVLMFDLPSVRLQTFYQLHTASSDEAHVLGEVTLCFVDAENRRPRRAPENFLKGLKKQLIV